MSYDHLAASEPPPFPITRTEDRKDYLALGLFLLRPALDGLGRAGRPALDRVIDAAGSWMRSLAGHLVNGVLPLGKWFVASAHGLIARHYAGTLALTKGATPPPKALDTLDAAIDRQAGRLLRWKRRLAEAAGAVGRGLVASVKQILHRAGSYAGSIWATAMTTRRRMMAEAAKSERRMLEEGNHHCGDCPHLASLGWQLPGTLPDIGDTECGAGCRCWFIYR